MRFTQKMPDNISSMMSYVILVASLLLSSHAFAAAVITVPAEGSNFIAEPCPQPLCPAPVPFTVQVSGDSVTAVVLEYTGSDAVTRERSLCEPPDPIEPHGPPTCPAPPFSVSPHNGGIITLWEDSYTVVARLDRDAGPEYSSAVHFTVSGSNPPPPGPVTLQTAEAPDNTPVTQGTPRIMLRAPGADYPSGLYYENPDRIVITGDNITESINPFLEYYVAPIPFGEPDLTSDSALPVNDYCLFPLNNVADLSPTEVEFYLPELPGFSPSKCGDAPSPDSSLFQTEWRFLVRDPWGLPDRDPVHTWWAIPSPRLGPLHDAPAFRMVKPEYPKIDGFAFPNVATGSSYYEFLTIYGNRAYHCVGALGFCATHAPKPIYHTMWYGIFRLFISQTGGSCNGLSATSLLFAHEELQTEDFNPDVRFPAGWDRPGDPYKTTTNDDGNTIYKGISKYIEPDWCTPVCSPPKPKNLWANVRMNHGVQFSREFLKEVLDTLGESFFYDLSSIKGIPETTLNRVRANPRGYVTCFFGLGNGHCVTPYRVVGDEMYVYDNNYPTQTDAIIDFSSGDYYYQKRKDNGSDLYEGNAIMAFPLSIWRNDRNLWGMTDAAELIGGELVDFLMMLAVGSADMTVSDGSGRWGWEDDGSFSDNLPGAMSIAPLGPQDTEPTRLMPLILAMNQSEPEVRINAKGGQYLWHAGAAGHQMQIEAADAQTGDKDRVRLGYADQGLTLRSFEFTPQRDAAHFIPRIGLVFNEQESVLMHWQGLDVPGGKSVALAADRSGQSALLENDTGKPLHHMLMMDHVSGIAETWGRMVYGPFEVPEGASQRIRLHQWPDVSSVLSELDFDRDGQIDHSQVIDGFPAETPTGLDKSADLAVYKIVEPENAELNEPVTFSISVSNAGPDDASDVVLIDSLPVSGVVDDVETDQGACSVAGGVLSCDLGTLAAGDEVLLFYTITPTSPGTLANAATVFGNEGDPDQTNNSVVESAHVPMPLDILPGNPNNRINLKKSGVLPVAILGGDGVDVSEINRSSLRFGPAGAEPVHRSQGHVAVGNGKGRSDLVLHFSVNDSGLGPSDSEACLSGRFVDGRAFEGCDRISIKH